MTAVMKEHTRTEPSFHFVPLVPRDKPKQQISHGNSSNKYHTAIPATNITRHAQQPRSHGNPSNKYQTESPVTNIARQAQQPISQQHISHGKPSNKYHTVGNDGCGSSVVRTINFILFIYINILVLTNSKIIIIDNMIN